MTVRLPHKRCQQLAGSLSRGVHYGHGLTDEQILRIAARGGFNISCRYRDDKIRFRAHRLKELGLLIGGRGPKFGDGHTYRATPAGMATLGCMEALNRKEKAKV